MKTLTHRSPKFVRIVAAALALAASAAVQVASATTPAYACANGGCAGQTAAPQ